MKHRIAAVVMLTAISAAGCTANNELGGQAVGGALGGLLGAQIGDGAGQLAATAAGAVLGAYIGGRVGASMDETDRIKANQALEGTRTGQSVAWVNPDSRSEYTVTPTRTYETADGPCREYTTTGTMDGKRTTMHGTACRQPDGSWKTVTEYN
ncbi:MAG: RT0821/Lpp0805 family surface protein [Gammaproteobacteria bacterium]